MRSCGTSRVKNGGEHKYHKSYGSLRVLELAAYLSEFLITDRVFVTFKDSMPSEDVAAFAGQ